MKNRILKNMEWGILICCIMLFVIGNIALYSTTQENQFDELKKQLMWSIISIPIMIIVICIDYELIAKCSPFFYGIFIILLIAVLFTPQINGATSWFKITEEIRFQPSEFAKVFVIIFLAYIMSIIQIKNREEINKPLKLLLTLSIVIVPVLLIIKQPDYGTAIAFMMATVLMLFAAGIDKRYIITTVVIIIITIPLAYNFLLPDHAKTRIDVFLNPDLDPRGSGYNVIQSKLAVGSGQLFGMGLLKGNQTHYRFYLFCYRRRNGIYYSKFSYNIICNTNYKSYICSKNSKRRYRLIYSNRNSRNIYISYDRKHRNDYGITTNNWCTTSICKLWRKFANYELYMYRNVIKY